MAPFVGQLDIGFRCHHCVRPIEEGMAVYMACDASFCSQACRRKGRSITYSKLAGLPDLGELRGSPSCSNTSAVSSAASESTGTSSASARAGGASDSQTGGMADAGKRVLGWILRVGLRQLTGMARGTELLRVGSSDAGNWGAAATLTNEPSCLRASRSRFSNASSDEHPLHLYQEVHARHLTVGSTADFVRLIEGVSY